MAPAAARLLTGGAAVAIVALGTVSVVRNDPGRLLETALCAGAVVVGAVLVRREPRSPVGPALAWTTGSLAFVGIHDLLPELPWSVGVWPVNLAGLFALLLVFPAGRRPGLTWRLAPWLFVIASACLVVSLWGAKVVDGAVTGSPGQAAPAVGVVGLVLVGVSMVIAVAHLVVSYRRGEQREREQIRWLMLAGIVVVVLLVGGWVAESFGAGVDVAYTPFVAAIATLVPAAVGVAIVRHDLFDVDRLLGESASWSVTLVLSAGVFGGVVLLVGQLVDEVTEVGSTAAAFVTALLLLPLQRNVHRRVSRVIDRDRFVAVALVDAFAADVRNGRREPEEIEAVLREAQGDPELVLLLAGPGGGWVRVDSTPATEQPGVTVESRGDPIARIVLRWDSSRARRQLRELSAAAWVPIEVTRLRLVLRDALEETRASRPGSPRPRLRSGDDSSAISTTQPSNAWSRPGCGSDSSNGGWSLRPRPRSMARWPSCRRRSTSCAGWRRGSVRIVSTTAWTSRWPRSGQRPRCRSTSKWDRCRPSTSSAR